MEFIMQPAFSTCGQVCIAMIAGKSVEEVIKDMKTDGATSIGQLIEILVFYSIGHAERNKRTRGIHTGRCFMIKRFGR